MHARQRGWTPGSGLCCHLQPSTALCPGPPRARPWPGWRPGGSQRSYQEKTTQGKEAETLWAGGVREGLWAGAGEQGGTASLQWVPCAPPRQDVGRGFRGARSRERATARSWDDDETGGDGIVTGAQEEGKSLQFQCWLPSSCTAGVMDGFGTSPE